MGGSTPRQVEVGSSSPRGRKRLCRMRQRHGGHSTDETSIDRLRRGCRVSTRHRRKRKRSRWGGMWDGKIGQDESGMRNMARGDDADVAHEKGGDGGTEDADVCGTAVTTGGGTELGGIETVGGGSGGWGVRGGCGGDGGETFEITWGKIGGETQFGYAGAGRHWGGGLHGFWCVCVCGGGVGLLTRAKRGNR